MTQKKVSRWVAILIVGIILTACISLTQGELSVSFMDLKALLLGQGSQAKQLLVWDFRLPRIVLAGPSGRSFRLKRRYSSRDYSESVGRYWDFRH